MTIFIIIIGMFLFFLLWCSLKMASLADEEIEKLKK